MCGLVGLIGTHRVPNLAEVIAGMNQTLHHRGPDQTGVFVHPDGKAALAHKRLSILDLINGIQPMTDAEGLFTLVFNGEIYNHGELKAELAAKGHPVHTRSDTETLLYAYKEWGAGCLPKLRGMFAFAVYDHRDGSVFLARDRLGIKPMYYGRHGNHLIFASECKAILDFPGFGREMDLEALSDYFSLMYVPSPKSIFKRIRKLPPGHWLKAAPGGEPVIQPYWDVHFEAGDEGGSEKDIAHAREELLACLEDCVGSHMESDVPLGAFLSGGVDSAAVMALMAKMSKRPVLSNTIGFGNRDFDESRYAAETAAFYKADHQEFRVEADAVEAMEKLAWHYDEPFADSSMIPTYYVCQMARRRVAVALSGDGGDENFAGYRRYYFDRVENRARALLPDFLRRPLFGLLGAVYPKADWLPQPLRAKTLLRNLSYSPLQGYFTSMSHFLPEMKARLFTSDLRRALGGYDSLSVFESHWARCKSRDPLSRIQYLDFKTYLTDDILVKVDRASMAHSLEVRVPLLDHKLVELAAKMPSGWKLRDKTSKFIFKQTVEPLLPPGTLTRRKSGFSAPIGHWFRNELRQYGQERLLGNPALAQAGLDTDYVRKLWEQHQSGLKNHDFPLFAMLSFVLWHSKFMERK
ncbi:MAG: asparagine synthase (glutamine-hydrolyzing) [Fibrobacteres bacterium]|jgi:asparagine synthase (glutamine-hydrolysing)|nr:asparagine synthase (glutamine-hydrolyzing) [Fibrobacterota bacterium]